MEQARWTGKGMMHIRGSKQWGAVVAVLGTLRVLLVTADAQLTDITQTPNTVDAGAT
jgi:hypothetical protein